MVHYGIYSLIGVLFLSLFTYWGYAEENKEDIWVIRPVVLTSPEKTIGNAREIENTDMFLFFGSRVEFNACGNQIFGFAPGLYEEQYTYTKQLIRLWWHDLTRLPLIPKLWKCVYGSPTSSNTVPHTSNYRTVILSTQYTWSIFPTDRKTFISPYLSGVISRNRIPTMSKGVMSVYLRPWSIEWVEDTALNIRSVPYSSRWYEQQTYWWDSHSGATIHRIILPIFPRENEHFTEYNIFSHIPSISTYAYPVRSIKHMSVTLYLWDGWVKNVSDRILESYAVWFDGRKTPLVFTRPGKDVETYGIQEIPYVWSGTSLTSDVYNSLVILIDRDSYE